MTMQINMDQLNLMTSGNADLALEVLGIFRSQYELWGPLLDAHAEPVQWADACHTIKGAAKSIGADELAVACETAETRGRQGEVSQVEAAVLLTDVKNLLGEAMEAIAHVEHDLTAKQPFRAEG